MTYLGPLHSEDGGTTLLRNVSDFQWLLNSQHNLTSHKTRIFINTAVRISNREFLPGLVGKIKTLNDSYFWFASRVLRWWVRGHDWQYIHNKVPYYYVWTTTGSKPAAKTRHCQHSGLNLWRRTVNLKENTHCKMAYCIMKTTHNEIQVQVIIHTYQHMHVTELKSYTACTSYTFRR